MSKEVLPDKLMKWLGDPDIRPYVFVRKKNRVKDPGQGPLDWFEKQPLYFDPLRMENVGFANAILNLEGKAFDASGMPMERWVFYDCALMPGFVCGFAARTKSLPASVIRVLGVDSSLEWTPLSLFIIIPSMVNGEWVAHNLSSVNALIPKEERFWGIGFMSKAFGLWYANIQTCCGMTQWKSPALKLHSHYGYFQILTAYTPVHTYSKTVTYRLNVDTNLWPGFFGHRTQTDFIESLEYSGFLIEPDSEESMKHFQARLEERENDYFLDAQEILDKPLDAALRVYQRK